MAIDYFDPLLPVVPPPDHTERPEDVPRNDEPEPDVERPRDERPPLENDTGTVVDEHA